MDDYASLFDAISLSQRGHGYGIVPVEVPLHNDLRLSCLQGLNFHGFCCFRLGRPITADSLYGDFGRRPLIGYNLAAWPRLARVNVAAPPRPTG